MLLQDTVLPKSEGGTWPVFLGGGRAASARTWMGRPFPRSQTAAQWRGVAFWEVVSFAPSLLARSVSGRAPRPPPPSPGPCGALPRRRLLDGLRRSCPARGALSLRVLSPALCPCVYPASPPTLPGLRGLSDPHPRFLPKKPMPSERGPELGPEPGPEPSSPGAGACGLSHGAGLRARESGWSWGLKRKRRGATWGGGPRSPEPQNRPGLCGALVSRPPGFQPRVGGDPGKCRDFPGDKAGGWVRSNCWDAWEERDRGCPWLQAGSPSCLGADAGGGAEKRRAGLRGGAAGAGGRAA